MKRWILVAMCVFLYTMPVHATEISIGEENSSVEETVEESSDSATAEGVVEEEKSIPQPGSSQVEESSELVSSTDETDESDVQQTTEEITTEEVTTEEVTTEEVTTEEVTTEEVTTEEVTTEETVTEVDNSVPDVIGMDEETAVAALEAVEFEDGSKIEVIKVYQYTNSAQKGTIYEVSLSDVVSEDGTKQVTIYISEGEDPDIANAETKVNWDEIPESYEYNWDNSYFCWYGGIWLEEDGVLKCYKSEEGTYNTDVRHKIQLYTDGTYVYTRIVFSRDYLAAANGNCFEYTVNGIKTKFQVEQYDGKDLASNNLDPGTYSVVVRHENSDVSYCEAEGASAYYTVNDSKVNAELEIKIPLSELAKQQKDIDLDAIGMIEFFTPNLMYQTVKTAGASTSPFTSAVSALVLVPGTALFINRKRKKLNKEQNE